MSLKKPHKCELDSVALMCTYTSVLFMELCSESSYFITFKKQGKSWIPFTINKQPVQFLHSDFLIKIQSSTVIIFRILTVIYFN